MTTKSPDALAMELAQSAAADISDKFLESGFQGSIADIILRQTKLRELCACAEALRECLPYLTSGGFPSMKDKAQQALDALDSTSHH